jgi:hypothetical protein
MIFIASFNIISPSVILPNNIRGFARTLLQNTFPPVNNHILSGECCSNGEYLGCKAWF